MIQLHPSEENGDNLQLLIIQEAIIDYDYNDRFVIASVCPKDSVVGIKELSYEDQKQAWINSTFREYFILVKSLDTVIGPLSFATYIGERNRLLIPTNLVLSTRSISQSRHKQRSFN